jgi:hypothetical protein
MDRSFLDISPLPQYRKKNIVVMSFFCIKQIRMIMKKYFFLFLLVFVGCGQPQPMEYTNTNHEYNIQIPAGWSATKTIPPIVKSSFDRYHRDKIRLITTNKRADGTIVVMSFRRGDDVTDWTEKLTESIERRWQQTIADKTIENYTYSSSVYDFNPPCLIAEQNFLYEDDRYRQNFLINRYVHPCREDDTCVVIFTLISPTSTYSENHAGFVKMIKKFEKTGVDS